MVSLKDEYTRDYIIYREKIIAKGLYFMLIFIAIVLFTFLFSCSFPAVMSAYICIFPTHTVHTGPQDTIDDSPFPQSLPLAGL